MPISTASTRLTIAWVLMNPPRVAHTRCRTSARCGAAGLPATCRSHGRKRGPSLRKKNATTIAVNRVTSADVAAPTPVNNPDAILALLELRVSLIASTPEFNCASLMLSGGPPSQSRTSTTPAVACSASSPAWLMIAGVTAARTPASTAIAATSTSSAAAAGGSPLPRNQRTGGHSTVHTIRANTTGSRITQVSPITHDRIHTAAATATRRSDALANDWRCRL